MTTALKKGAGRYVSHSLRYSFLLFACLFIRATFTLSWPILHSHITLRTHIRTQECNYEVQGRAVLAVMRGLSALGLKDLTLVQLKQLVTNSKDKKLDRYREGLERRGVDVVVRHVVKGKHVVMTKDGCDALLQVQYCRRYNTDLTVCLTH